MEAKTRRQGVIKRSRVRLDEPGHGPQESPADPTGIPQQSAAVHAPRVRLLRLDESTQAIELVCPCGEVSLIEIRSEKKP